MQFLRAATQPPAGCRHAARRGEAAPARPKRACTLVTLALGLAASAALGFSHTIRPPPALPQAAGRSGLRALPRGSLGDALPAALAGERRSYALSAAPGGFGAYNAAQRLRVRFAGAGLWIASGGTLVALRPYAVGQAGSWQPLGAVSAHARADRVSYTGAGVSGSYANGPLGVEQGFTIARPPAGRAGTPVTLVMTLAGNAHAAMGRGAQSVQFDRAGGGALRYGSLLITDAGGHRLAGRMQLAPGRLLLHVDARGARYPLHIDPLIQQGEKLTGSEEAGSQIFFGESAALSADGNTALVGGPFDDGGIGAAWVFTRSDASWSQQGAKLSGPGEGGGFGTRVALSSDGNTALIGGTGAALVFTRSGSSWTRQGAALRGSGASGVPGAGVALSGDGNTALIGGATGTAWVFTRSGSTWTQQGEALVGSGTSGGGDAGSSVALSGDGNTALIGGAAAGGGLGAAWVFTRTGATWTQQGEALTGREESGQGELGYAAALSGDGNTALLGGPGDEGHHGAAWIFTRAGSAWSAQGEKLTGAGELSPGFFGYSVALSASGDTALVGAHDDGTFGSVWVLERTRRGWIEQPGKLNGGGEVGFGAFGSSVALSEDGETALIGGHGDENFTGAAWVFVNVPTPTLTRLSSRDGPSSGGVPVTITGTNLLEATAVSFGAAAASSFTVNSPTSLTAVSPAEPEGRVNVTVSTREGSSAISAADRYLFRPAVTGVSPGAAPASALVTVTGAGFIPGAAASGFRFGSARAGSVYCSSSTLCTVLVPARAPGTVDVRATVSGVASPRSPPGDSFTYQQ